MSPFQLRSVVPVLLVEVFTTVGAYAQTAAVGAELQVNTHTPLFQRYAAVARDRDGRFIVVWQSDGSTGTDSSGSSIQGQRYDAAGRPIGSQFQVNSYTDNNQYRPTVATDHDGSFVVVWDSLGSNGTDTSASSVQGQLFHATGAPVGGQFQINTYTTSNQFYSAVATRPDGSFVVAWTSYGSSGTDTSFLSVQGQLFDATGAPFGAQFQVNSYTDNDQNRPAVATTPDGDFVVVWESNGSNGTDSSQGSIQRQRYDASGNPLGSQLQVNSYTTSNQSLPAVAADRDGDFVVVWDSVGSSGTDTSSTSAQGQRYDVDGNPIGSQFQVNSYTTNSQTFPAVAADRDGDFVVVWESFGSSGTDTSLLSIQGQRYRVTGELGDLVFFDRDFDGIQDPGETGLAGVPVHLFDPFATLARSTITDASGLYRFKPKSDRQYYLQFELPSNQSFTAMDRGADDSRDSDADVLTGETDTFSLAVFSSDLSWDAGMANGVGDRVWLDLDMDGIQDTGELGYGPGVRVELVTQPADAVLVATTTDADGRYSFPSVPQGDYTLSVAAPAGAALTVKDAGANDLADSDPDPLDGSTDPFSVSLGDLDLTRDAGLVTSNTIGDRVWLDLNANGIQDRDEPGRSGIIVNLRVTGGTIFDSTTTDRNGFFGFAPGPGLYTVEVLLPAGLAFTQRDQGNDDAIDSDVDPVNGFTPFVAAFPGIHVLTWDAGLVALPVFTDGFESGDTSVWSSTGP